MTGVRPQKHSGPSLWRLSSATAPTSGSLSPNTSRHQTLKSQPCRLWGKVTDQTEKAQFFGAVWSSFSDQTASHPKDEILNRQLAWDELVWLNWKWIRCSLPGFGFNLGDFNGCLLLHVLSKQWFCFGPYTLYFLFCFFSCLLFTTRWHADPALSSFLTALHASLTHKHLHTRLSLPHLLSSVHSCGCGSFLFFFCPRWHHRWCHPPLRPIIRAKRWGHCSG